MEHADLIARALAQLGRYHERVCQSQQQLRHAAQLLEDALAFRAQITDQRDVAYVETRLGWIFLNLGAHERTVEWAQHAVDCYHVLGDEAGATVPLLLLGIAAGRRGDVPRARELMRRALETICHLQDQRLLLLECNTALWCFGDGRTEPERMATILGVVEGLEARTRSRSPAPQAEWTSNAAAALKSRLGTERFAQARAAGIQLGFSEVCALIGDLTEMEQTTYASTDSPTNGLSGRAHQILQLVAEGLTNKEIAARLVLTENTVKTHITSIFNKFGVDSRASAVAVAAHAGLLDGVTR